MNVRLAPGILLLPALVLATQAGAQGRIEVGAKSGLARNSVTAGREFLWGGTTTSSAAFVRYALTERVAAQAEAQLSHRVGVSTIGSTALTMQADYLEAPVLLQWQAASAGPLSAYLTGGALVAYRYSCRLRFEGGGVRTDDECDAARGVQSNKIDLAGLLGVGVRLGFGPITVLGEARATHGLATNVLPIDSTSARTTGFSMMLGASIPVSLMRRSRGPVPRAQDPRLPMPGASFPVQTQRETAEATGPIVLPEVPAPVRINVDADAVDLAEVVAGIASATNTSITLDPSVRRSITLRLRYVTAEEAIEAITYRTGLGMVRAVENGRSVMVLRPVTPAGR